MWEIEAEPGCSGWCAASCFGSCVDVCLYVTGGMWLMGGYDSDVALGVMQNPIIT